MLPFALAYVPATGKLEQVVTDLSKLEAVKDKLQGGDVAFCTLGTTRRDAGSAEAFRKIDLDTAFDFARLCKEAQVSHFSLLTSQGADPNSFWLCKSSILHPSSGQWGGGCAVGLTLRFCPQT